MTLLALVAVLSAVVTSTKTITAVAEGLECEHIVAHMHVR